MEQIDGPKTLRENIRLLERLLGILDDLQSSCCGVTFAQCHALVEVGRAGASSLNDLAVVLDLDKSTMSRTIENLVKSELAVRESDSNDRRYVDIKLTEKGLLAYREIEEKMDTYFTQVYQAIPENQRQKVLESLDLLIEALRSNKCCSSCHQ